jgi:hypothetical protein
MKPQQQNTATVEHGLRRSARLRNQQQNEESQPATVPEDALVAEDKKEEEEPVATMSKFVVVTTTYPSTYGCNYGQDWNEVDHILRSDVEVTAPVDSYEKALKIATKIRNRSGWFDDHPYDEEDEPPWDSSIMENYDNDEEVCIRITTQENFKADQEKDQKTVDATRNKSKRKTKKRGLKKTK